MLNSNQIASLLNVKGIGRKTVYQIWSEDIEFSDVDELYKYLLDTTKRNTRYPLPEYADFKNEYDKGKVILDESQQNSIHVITIAESRYPKRLKGIPDPPLVLYVKGNVECIDYARSVAIVGTRKPTEYGKRIAERLGEYFAESDYIVVSGLAEGCDTHAHIGCLRKKGKTVAVLAHGLDKVYPSKNRDLADEILEYNGCLVSEHPVGVRARSSYFVDRDRIQSGLSDGVLVVETGIQSGTMHTVKFCREQGRILACYKHPDKYLNESSVMGNIQLLKEGSIAIEDEISLIDYIKRMSSDVNPKSNLVSKSKKQSNNKNNEYPLFEGIIE